MATIGSALSGDGVDTFLTLTEQASAPATPATGERVLYAKADGLYEKDDAGTETGPLGTGGGGGGGGMTLISTQTLAAAAAQIDFTSIPSTYKDLLVTGRLRSAAASALLGVRAGGASLDAGANYRWQWACDGSTESQLRAATDTEWELTSDALPGTGGDASTWANVELRIFDYADTTYRRSMTARVFSHYSSTIYLVWDAHCEWLNTADAIQQLRFFNPLTGGNWATGSKLRLYGLG